MEDTRSDAYKEEAALAQMSNFPRTINLENSKDQCTTVSNRLGRLSVGVLGGMYTRQPNSPQHPRLGPHNQYRRSLEWGVLKGTALSDKYCHPPAPLFEINRELRNLVQSVLLKWPFCPVLSRSWSCMPGHHLQLQCNFGGLIINGPATVGYCRRRRCYFPSSLTDESQDETKDGRGLSMTYIFVSFNSISPLLL